MINFFISYSHKDEDKISTFITHFTPFLNDNKDKIKIWYDRFVNGGDDFQDKIDEHFYKSDIIALFISANFLSSTACLKELEEALKLKQEKGIIVVPVLLSVCDWKSNQQLKKLLIIPTDGKPISKFTDENDGYLDVIGYLKKNISESQKIKEITLKKKIEFFLNDSELLAKSHKNKEILLLDDIFINRTIKTYDDEENSDITDFNSILLNLNKFPRKIIAGENQSGKTTLSKKIYKKYRELGYFPVYIDGIETISNIKNKVDKELSLQYDNISSDINIAKLIIPIIDNFHEIKNKEKILNSLQDYDRFVLSVDEIFGLDLNNQDLIKDIHKLKIRELNQKERHELIKKWIKIGKACSSDNIDFLQELDEKTEIIESSLGIIFGKGVMPCYPFFILSLLSTYDTQNSLDTSVTSQGHCYQALIYMYLRKQGVKNEHIDIYLNFLTELSYFLYKNNKKSISTKEVNEFIDYYKGKFNFPLDIKDVLNNLAQVNICKYDSFRSFQFCYLYIYYYFIGKYIAENLNDNNISKELSSIISNLHQDENAYITIFTSHHTKSNILLDEIVLNAAVLFEKLPPASLNKKELKFFDNNLDSIIQAILPSYSNNPNKEREKILVNHDEKKGSALENASEYESDYELDEQAKDLSKNLRLSLKTVEVMGLIIKNRAGSLDKSKLEEIFTEGLNLNFRILSSFINIISNHDIEEVMVSILQDRINNIIEENKEENKQPTTKDIEKLVREIYWNLNFGILHGIITKTIHSLGSNNLLNITQSVSDSMGTPAAFIVNQGIRMWYSKNLRIDEISSRIMDSDFSKTAERLIKFKIAEHCRLHKIEFKDMQKLESKLNMSSKTLTIDRLKAVKS
ncbi:TIR domain-containing protein [Elizabethkingia anophelis]